MSFDERKTAIAVNLFSDVLIFLKEKFKIGDEINYTKIFIKYKCGYYVSQTIIYMLEDFGYVSSYNFDGVPRRVIKLPEEVEINDKKKD